VPRATPPSPASSWASWPPPGLIQKQGNFVFCVFGVQGFPTTGPSVVKGPRFRKVYSVGKGLGNPFVPWCLLNPHNDCLSPTTFHHFVSAFFRPIFRLPRPAVGIAPAVSECSHYRGASGPRGPRYSTAGAPFSPPAPRFGGLTFHLLPGLQLMFFGGGSTPRIPKNTEGVRTRREK